MIGKIERRSLSLLELFRRAKLAEQARRTGTVYSTGEARSQGRGEIVDRRDQRGTPYPGDFPNDLTRLYRGCF